MTPVQIKNTARLRMATAVYPPQRLALLYAAITLGGSFLSMLLSYAVGLMMENTGGLSGLDTRAVMETASAVFSFAVRIVTPLLFMGFVHSTILVTREKPVCPKTLLTGFKRWALLLRHTLLQSLIFLCLGYFALQVSTVIFTFLPGSENAMSLMMGFMEDPAILAGDISDAQISQMVKAMAPAYIIAAALFIAAYIPVSYRLRLGSFRVMEDAPVGAVKATLQSLRLMKGNCKALFRLDLSFWWYYLLQFLPFAAVTVLGLWVSDFWYLMATAVHCLILLWLDGKYLAYMQVSYAVFYEDLLTAATAPTLPQIEQ